MDINFLVDGIFKKQAPHLEEEVSRMPTKRFVAGTRFPDNSVHWFHREPLYEQLTVDQNIRFFGGVYGLAGQAFEARRRFVLDMAGLVGRERVRAADLAGGWGFVGMEPGE